MKTKPSSLKTIVIISGIMGVLLGIAMTYFLFPRVVTQQNVVTTETTVVDTIFVEKEKLVYRSNKLIDETNIGSDTIRVDSAQIIVADSLGKLYSEVADTDDAGMLYSQADSLNVNLDTTNVIDHTEYASDGTGIRVAENELVFVSYIKPSGNPAFFYCRDENDDLDSLLVDNYVPKPKTDKIRVEFWSSPIHAIGYRLNKNRLVLFGFYEYKNVSLKYLENGGVQMLYFDNVYTLNCGDEFNTLNISKR